MHEAFWNGLFDVRWEEAPLGAEAIRLTVRLRERGYAERTCRDYGHAVVHLGGVLHEELGSEQVRDEGVVADFLAGHLPGCRCYRGPVGHREEPVRRGLAHLLVMLREEGAIPPVVVDQPLYHELIEGYCRFLRRDRGLAETTVVNYQRYLRDFLISRGAVVSPAALVALGADDLLAFSRQRGAGLGAPRGTISPRRCRASTGGWICAGTAARTWWARCRCGGATGSPMCRAPCRGSRCVACSARST